MQSGPLTHSAFCWEHSPLDLNVDFNKELPVVYGHQKYVR